MPAGEGPSGQVKPSNAPTTVRAQKPGPAPAEGAGGVVQGDRLLDLAPGLGSVTTGLVHQGEPVCPQQNADGAGGLPASRPPPAERSPRGKQVAACDIPEHSTLNEQFRRWLTEYAAAEDRVDAYARVMESLAAVRTGGRFTRDERSAR